MPYTNRTKKISEFIKGSAISNSTELSSIDAGVNKTFTVDKVISATTEAIGQTIKMFALESELVSSDAALGDYVVVEENSYGLYKITNDAVTGDNVALDSGLTATFIGPIATPPLSEPTGVPILTQSSTIRTLDGTEGGKMILTSNISGCTVIVPLESTLAEPFPDDAEVHLANGSGGTVGFSPSVGVSISKNSKYTSNFLSAQYAVATLKKRGTNNWLLFGDLEV